MRNIQFIASLNKTFPKLTQKLHAATEKEVHHRAGGMSLVQCGIALQWKQSCGLPRIFGKIWLLCFLSYIWPALFHSFVSPQQDRQLQKREDRNTDITL